MNRRDFIQMSLATGASLFLPSMGFGAPADILDQIQFNPALFSSNNPRVIMVFLYGGASELAGNFTNIEEIKALSQSSYDNHFGSGNLVATTNGFWRSAGGDIMEELIDSSDLSVLRTCYSEVREVNNNKSHGSCVNQNQRGSFTENTSGIFSNLVEILKRNGIVGPESVMPLLSMEGGSAFFAEGEMWLETFLKPLTINEYLHNPYTRRYDPKPEEYSAAMDSLAQSINPEGKIKEAFQKRAELEEFINNITENAVTPEEANYANNSFARKLETAINVMSQNPDTRIISTGSGGLGGWDDHNDAENYLSRMTQLMDSLRSACIHLKSVDPEGEICILVMGEFGRNVNLNSAMGWDHGNLQNLYVLRGGKYFKSIGPYGSTVVDDEGSVNRLYLKPHPSSYWFEPFGVAATIYSIFGIMNPTLLTGGVDTIQPLVT